MVNSSPNSILLSADGTPLKKSLSRSLRQQKIRALLLISPLLIFILVAFIMPIVSMLSRSVENDLVSQTLPATVSAIQSWDALSGELPDEQVYKAFAQDIQNAAKAKVHTKVALRLNYEKSGIASLFKKTARKAKKWDIQNDGPFKDKLIKVHKGWGEIEVDILVNGTLILSLGLVALLSCLCVSCPCHDPRIPKAQSCDEHRSGCWCRSPCAVPCSQAKPFQF